MKFEFALVTVGNANICKHFCASENWNMPVNSLWEKQNGKLSFDEKPEAIWQLSHSVLEAAQCKKCRECANGTLAVYGTKNIVATNK